MKKLWMLCLSLMVCVGLSACTKTESNETESKKLVIYSPNSEGLIQATIPLFEEETGIKVELMQAGT